MGTVLPMSCLELKFRVALECLWSLRNVLSKLTYVLYWGMYLSLYVLAEEIHILTNKSYQCYYFAVAYCTFCHFSGSFHFCAEVSIYLLADSKVTMEGWLNALSPLLKISQYNENKITEFPTSEIP